MKIKKNINTTEEMMKWANKLVEIKKNREAMDKIDQMVVVARYGMDWVEGEQEENTEYYHGGMEATAHIIACMMSKLTKQSVGTCEIADIIVRNENTTDGELCNELIKFYKDLIK